MIRKNERGAALLVVMIGLSIVLASLLIALGVSTYSGRAIKRNLSSEAQALNAANAGLTETLSFFRRQGGAVTTFNPLLDANGVCTHTPLHDPLRNDTDDPSIGLVRSFEMMEQGSVTGRYVVSKTNANVRDLSVERGLASTDDGTVWQIECEGSVIGPNNMLFARRTLRTEIKRLQVRLPALAAIFVGDGSRTSIDSGTRVRGGNSNIGIAYRNGTTAPSPPAGTVTGSPITASTTAGFDYVAVFGMSRAELVQSADLVVPSVADIVTYPTMGLVVVQGNAVFGPSPGRPLTGSGILVVTGNLTVQQNSLSLFNGVIYVEGTVTIQEPATINGALIVAKSSGTGTYLTLDGGADFVEVNYDSDMLDQVRAQMGQYRFIRAPYIVGGKPE
jgi:outer membrane murein-binding lipoprotein Lpp